MSGSPPTPDAVPRYPRIPHLARGRAGTRDDLVLDARERSALLAGRVRIEEKLDGASVALWLRAGIVQTATRGGAGARDRAGQLGRLRSWCGQHNDALRSLLGGGRVLYAEWLLLTHTVRYDALPDWLIGLDLWTPSDGFAWPPERDAWLAEAGIATAPPLYDGTLGAFDDLDALIGRSCFGADRAEGVVIRRAGPGPGLGPRLAKRLAAGFERAGDEAWSGAPRYNGLAGAVVG